jgi:hypothetical protein
MSILMWLPRSPSFPFNLLLDPRGSPDPLVGQAIKHSLNRLLRSKRLGLHVIFGKGKGHLRLSTAPFSVRHTNSSDETASTPELRTCVPQEFRIERHLTLYSMSKEARRLIYAFVKSVYGKETLFLRPVGK